MTSSPPSDDLDVAVIGAGLMGHAIAAAFVARGATVAIHDPDAATLAATPQRVTDLLDAAGLPSTGTLRLAGGVADAVGRCRLVVEAAPEVLELKQDLFAQLDALAPGAILATNTSVFKIADVAARTTRPERVVGTHWWNPPHLIPLVEVTQGASTADATVLEVMDILTRVGKAPVHVRRDVPGFIGNRLQHAMWREAIALVEAGVCDAETIDTVVRSGFGLRLAAMGPMENADYVGLDLTRAVHAYVFPDLSTAAEPSVLLDAHIADGELGAKSGQGFFAWPAGEREAAAGRLERHLTAALDDEAAGLSAS